MNVVGKILLNEGLKPLSSILKIGGLPDIPNMLINIDLEVRMFLDSELGSPIEQVVEKAWTASCCKAVKSCLPTSFKWVNDVAERIGVFIARSGMNLADMTKLNYQYGKGMITLDKYSTEFADRTLAIAKSVVTVSYRNLRHLADHGVYITTKVISQSLEVPQEAAEQIASTVSKGINFLLICAKKPIMKLIESEGAKTVVAACVKTVCKGVDVIKEEAPKVVNKIATVVHKSVEQVKSIAQSVVSGTKVAIKKTEAIFARLFS